MALHAAAEELARPRVLVVDDEVCVAKLLADSLERDGLAVRVCHDGKSALEAALEWPAEVILLDARMPGMDGYEIWSGYDSVSDIVLAHDAGADDHVSKNASPAVVKAKIRRAVERARSGIHPPEFRVSMTC
jgi:DNA-binding response OmpR family regulator